MTPDDTISAAELALGLLEGAERAAAIARVLAEPAFAAEVAWWRGKLDALLADYPAAAAPEHLKERIAALVAERQGGATPTPIRHSRLGWAAGGMVGGAIAASAAALLLLPRAAPPAPVAVPSPVVVQVPGPIPSPEPARVLVAALTPAKGEERDTVTAVIDEARGTVRLVAGVEAPAGKVAELWRIGADASPRALGLLHTSKATVLTRPPVGVPRAGETLAISIEPAGGAPGEAPTGPVVATGVLERG